MTMQSEDNPLNFSAEILWRIEALSYRKLFRHWLHAMWDKNTAIYCSQQKKFVAWNCWVWNLEMYQTWGCSFLFLVSLYVVFNIQFKIVAYITLNCHITILWTIAHTKTPTEHTNKQKKPKPPHSSKSCRQCNRKVNNNLGIVLFSFTYLTADQLSKSSAFL